MSYNKISELSDKVFPNLRILFLSNNEMQFIPSGLKNFIDLRSLNLSGNSITYSKQDYKIISSLKNLISLYLRDNSISKFDLIEKLISDLSLRTLIISFNKFDPADYQAFREKHRSIMVNTTL